LQKKLETRTFKNFLGIFSSKLTGYIRDNLFASNFGSGLIMEAWGLGFGFLSSLKTALIDIPLESISIPILSKISNQKDKHEIASGSLLVKLVAYSIPSLILVSLFSKNIATLLTAYKSTDVEILSSLIRGLSGYLAGGIISIWASSVLRSQGRMLAASLTPIILNISIIGFVYLMEKSPVETLTAGAGWGAWLGVIFQLYAFGLGNRWPKINWANKYQEAFEKKYPQGASIGIFQSLTFISTRYYATLLASGSVAWLYFSTRLIQVPNSLIGVCIAQASLPELSKISNSKSPKFSRELEKALKMGFLIALPLTIYFFFEASFFTKQLFQRGEFTASDTTQVSNLLKILSLSLPFVIFESILTKAYYAINEHKELIRIKFIQFLSCLFVLFFYYYGDFQNKLIAVPVSSIFSIIVGVAFLLKKFQLNSGKILNPSARTRNFLIFILILFVTFEGLEPEIFNWIKISICGCAMLYIWKNEILKYEN